MTFLDEVMVTFVSGKGGDGAATFHREKHVPRGGPNGADGGRGGDVILVADRHMRTLHDFTFNSRYEAGSGTMAHGNKDGKDGDTLTIKVPVGTVVTEAGDDAPLADLGVEGMSFVICRGGRGGAGNLHYTNSVRQSPTFAQKGEPGEEVQVKLELKLLADAGLVGLPNAGKSTLLAQVSRAKPKVGAYPFTTITPNLGVVTVNHQSFVMADLPGLIEGASDGAGLGHRFLKHTERTKVLIHVVDGFPIDGTDPWENYRLIEEELVRYSEDLAARPRIVVINKIDLQSMGDLEALKEQFAATGHPVFAVSGATGEGTNPLLYAILAEIEKAEKEGILASPVVLKRIIPDDGKWDISFDGDEYVVTGKKIEKMVNMTQLENPEAVRHLHRRLERAGVIGKLRDMGIKEGDTVVINNWEFTYREW
jgi:GTP-binding protein